MLVACEAVAVGRPIDFVNIFIRSRRASTSPRVVAELFEQRAAGVADANHGAKVVFVVEACA